MGEGVDDIIYVIYQNFHYHYRFVVCFYAFFCGYEYFSYHVKMVWYAVYFLMWQVAQVLGWLLTLCAIVYYLLVECIEYLLLHQGYQLERANVGREVWDIHIWYSG